MRLVPDQDPRKVEELFTNYVRQATPSGVIVEVTKLHEAEPVLINIEGAMAEAAMNALEDVWGVRPVRVREGGTMPIVSTMSEVLDVPVLLLGFGLPDDAPHSPNEKFKISQYYDGIRATTRFLDRVGDVRA